MTKVNVNSDLVINQTIRSYNPDTKAYEEEHKHLVCVNHNKLLEALGWALPIAEYWVRKHSTADKTEALALIEEYKLLLPEFEYNGEEPETN